MCCHSISGCVSRAVQGAEAGKRRELLAGGAGPESSPECRPLKRAGAGQ